MAPSAQIRSSSVKSSCFRGRSSTIDSMTRSHLGQLVELRHRANAPEGCHAVVILELAAVDLLRERLLEGAHHLVRRVLSPAAEHDLEARLGGDLRDTRTHDPRTDDSHPLDRHEAQVTAQ